MFVLGCSLLYAAPAGALAALEDLSIMGSSPSNPPLFTLFQAGEHADKTVLTGARLTNTRTYEAKADADEGDTVLKGTAKEKEEAAGFLIPLGGASFGFTYSMQTQDLEGTHTSIGSKRLETLRHRHWNVRFLLDMTDSLSMGFSYDYFSQNDDILGNYFVGDDDRTQYKGYTSGYAVSLNQKFATWAVSAFHRPPLRGKERIEGEEKIKTEPGISGVGLDLTGNKQFQVRLAGAKWFYKVDDFSRFSTSPVDQDRISLYGIDVDQNAYQTQLISLGSDWRFDDAVSIRTGIFRKSLVWLFDEDSIPGENKSAEKPFSYYGYNLGFLYNKNNFSCQIGKILTRKQMSGFRDNEFTFGIRDYIKYKSGEDLTYISIGILH